MTGVLGGGGVLPLQETGDCERPFRCIAASGVHHCLIVSQFMKEIIRTCLSFVIKEVLDEQGEGCGSQILLSITLPIA